MRAAAGSLAERLRLLFRGPRPLSETAASPTPPRRTPGRGDKEIVTTRQSRGLEQFFSYIRDQAGLRILDLGGASQANVSFITNLGHKLYSVDLLRSMEETFGGEDPTDQSNAGQIDYLMRQNLEYPDETFDGVLVWDTLEYMAPALLSATLDRLHRITRPQSYMLAFFHSDERAASVPYYNFRIQEFNALQVSQRGSRKPVQLFNNRTLEKLFQRFDSVKFFLTKESLREVIVKR
ncbi:MAG TPA: methyltransferase domain-containing protein [Bryobacteraceae bacterium]|nr:methyltransferase domain-containing protein [Bryobacteraceae bacterium]